MTGSGRSGGAVDITQLILDDHHEQRRLFAMLEEVDRAQTRALADLWARLGGALPAVRAGGGDPGDPRPGRSGPRPGPRSTSPSAPRVRPRARAGPGRRPRPAARARPGRRAPAARSSPTGPPVRPSGRTPRAAPDRG